MGLAEVERFLQRLMNDEPFCRSFLADPRAVVLGSGLDDGERWAFVEALLDSDGTGPDFLDLLRTRLANVGTPIGRPPARLTDVFATERAHDAAP